MKLFKLTLLALPLVMISCGGGNEGKKSIADFIKEASDKSNKNEKPIKTSLEKIFTGEYDSEQTLIFEGYLGSIPSSITWANGKMSVRIFERRNQTGGNYVNLDMSLGTDKNEVKELPEEYKQSDLKVTTDNGKVIGVGAKVRVEATNYYGSTNYHSMEIVSIELIDEEYTGDVFKEAVPITSAILADTSKKIVYGYMDGVFAIPSVFFSMYGEIGLDFKNTTNREIKTVDVLVGEGPSNMNNLPSSYTAKDLVIRDYKGEVIKNGTKVRVYGVWERYSFETSGLDGKFKLEEIEVR